MDYLNEVCSYWFISRENKNRFVQLSDVTAWKLELVPFLFVNGPCSKKLYKN